MKNTSRVDGKTDKLQHEYEGPYEILSVCENGINHGLKLRKNVLRQTGEYGSYFQTQKVSVI